MIHRDLIVPTGAPFEDGKRLVRGRRSEESGHILSAVLASNLADLPATLLRQSPAG
ncbi:MAG: hypothetical protein OXG70_01490 [Cyanobacteria bacterium MAG IRC1_bin_28]|nr:hypothetical protein [Cyanobacteria bacterium MAG IRC3_bin_20]MCY3653699.1 hypothetical protein [Cyanobacteria bacterium MAG IRC1_bin_28]MDE0647946.1 hypothetical protein [Cyanobacteria bacterium MAG IRC4_bin_6]